MLRFVGFALVVALALYLVVRYRRGGHPDPFTQNRARAQMQPPANKLEGTAENFDRAVIEGSAGKLVIVDFWAPWCGPCQTLGQVLDEVAHQYGDRLRVVTVNVDLEAVLVTRFSVRSIPAVMFFRDGRKVDGFTGVRPRRQIDWMITQHLPQDVAPPAS